MLRLPEKVLLYLLRAAGVFLLHISGLMEYKDELKFYLPLPLPIFQDALDYTGYLPHLYFFAMVRKELWKFNFLILLPLSGFCSPADSKAQV